MLAGLRVFPVVRPESPAERVGVLVVEAGGGPVGAVDFHFHALDRRAIGPGSAADADDAIGPASDPGDEALDVQPADQRFGVDDLAVALLAANGHVIAGHETVLERAVDKFDAIEPFD